MTAQNEEVNCLKYRKMKMFKLGLILVCVWLVASFLDQSQSKVKYNWSNPGLISTLQSILLKKKILKKFKKIKGYAQS